MIKYQKSNVNIHSNPKNCLVGYTTPSTSQSVASEKSAMASVSSKGIDAESPSSYHFSENKFAKSLLSDCSRRKVSSTRSLNIKRASVASNSSMNYSLSRSASSYKHLGSLSSIENSWTKLFSRSIDSLCSISTEVDASYDIINRDEADEYCVNLGMEEDVVKLALPLGCKFFMSCSTIWRLFRVKLLGNFISIPYSFASTEFPILIPLCSFFTFYFLSPRTSSSFPSFFPLSSLFLPSFFPVILSSPSSSYSSSFSSLCSLPFFSTFLMFFCSTYLVFFFCSSSSSSSSSFLFSFASLFIVFFSVFSSFFIFFLIFFFLVLLCQPLHRLLFCLLLFLHLLPYLLLCFILLVLLFSRQFMRTCICC